MRFPSHPILQGDDGKAVDLSRKGKPRRRDEFAIVLTAVLLDGQLFTQASQGQLRGQSRNSGTDGSRVTRHDRRNA
jgi:hypothetical protein